MSRLAPPERRHVACNAVLVCAFSLLAGIAAAWVSWETTGYRPVATAAGTVAFVCTALACAAMALAVLCSLRCRNAVVESLTDRMNHVLRDPSSVQGFAEYEEGELAILANELQKVCVLLRDQAEGLRRERDALADSLADISHQLRTPLMSMNLALELLANRATGEARRRALVHELRELADHMGWLVGALLTLARADAGTLELARSRVDLAELVRAATDPLRIACELRGVALEIAAPPVGTSWFEGDTGWSREALANVVKNCLEHTPAGGTVRIEASADVLAARLIVADTGPGIAPEDLPHVFERFYRGGNAAAGSAGIGLALARCLVAAQGGTLIAGNGAHGGARFEMTFPKTTV